MRNGFHVCGGVPVPFCRGPGCELRGLSRELRVRNGFQVCGGVPVPVVGAPGANSGKATSGKGTGTEPIAPNDSERTYFGSEPVPFPRVL